MANEKKEKAEEKIEEETVNAEQPKEGFCKKHGITAKGIAKNVGSGFAIGVCLVAIPAAVAYGVATGTVSDDVVEETADAVFGFFS